uniref:C2H2-type domain-containing protein n=1 Tax=Heterorhabditis bacteriophora TaxID=37862 RepID=A0A1I7WPP3_HETBA
MCNDRHCTEALMDVQKEQELHRALSIHDSMSPDCSPDYEILSRAGYSRISF